MVHGVQSASGRCRNGDMKRSGKATPGDSQEGVKKRSKQSTSQVGSSSKNKVNDKSTKNEAGDVKAGDVLGWLNDKAKVRSWMSQYDLPKLLDEGKVRDSIVSMQ